MRIGLDLRMSGLDFGIGRYSFELVKKILEIDHHNDYILFVRDLEYFSKAGFENFSNIKLVKADFAHNSFAEQTKFYLLLRKHNLDLVHFMNFNVPLAYNKPFIATIHDVVHHRLPGNKKRRFLHRLAYKMVISHAAKKSKKIITVSNFSKKEIIDVFRIEANKISVIYEAANPIGVSDSDLIEIKQKYAITKPYIIFVGVMERKKNIPALTKGFDALKEKFGLNIQLVLVGKTDKYYPEVVDEAKNIKYAKDLIFTGSISDKEKFALYKGAEAFVSASLFEGFGLPGVEAMSLGTPLVVANIEVFNEVYDNGAIYFDPKDPDDIAQKIHLLLTDAKYRQLIANNAYQRAQFFSWERAAKETVAVYNSIRTSI